MPTQRTKSSSLCLDCALCCNGALFADVKLEACDEVFELVKAGLTLCQRGKFFRLTQPCAALGHDHRCRVYVRRPNYCRQFECSLLQKVIALELSRVQAQETVRRARRQLARVERLFGQLGDRNTHLPLKARLRKLTVRLSSEKTQPGIAAVFGDLTVAVHDLHLLLAREFYPGS